MPSRYGIKTVVCHHSGNLVVTRFAIVTVSPQGSCNSIYPVAVPMLSSDTRVNPTNDTRTDPFFVIKNNVLHVI